MKALEIADEKEAIENSARPTAAPRSATSWARRIRQKQEEQTKG